LAFSVLLVILCQAASCGPSVLADILGLHSHLRNGWS